MNGHIAKVTPPIRLLGIYRVHFENYGMSDDIDLERNIVDLGDGCCGCGRRGGGSGGDGGVLNEAGKRRSASITMKEVIPD